MSCVQKKGEGYICTSNVLESLCGAPRGGQKTKWKTPSPNFEELIESITNMLFFLSGGSRKKSYEVSKLRGGGGGGSWPKKLKKKNLITFLRVGVQFMQR